MPRFSAPPPNGDSRKALELRAREATRPVTPIKKGSWPFSADKLSASGENDATPVSVPDKFKKSRG